MKQLRPVLTAIAILMVGNAALALACDDSKQAKTSAAAMTASASKCSHASATAVTADNNSCAGMSAAECRTKMSAAQCAAVRATAAGAACSAKGAAAVTASSEGVCNHDAKSAAAGTSCGSKGAAAAMAAGTCSGHGMTTTAARSSHGDCDACLDMAGCEQEIESVGASTQVVPLKNGVMFVYTASSPANVHTVQAAMARRYERMVQFASTGDKAHLCTNCKAMRGAAASGKLSREIVNIEGGCLTLVTSNDPSVVAKIHTMAGITTAARVKS